MTKEFRTEDGRTITFTEVTAIWHAEPEAGRRSALLFHDSTDTYGDGDTIFFEMSLPETLEDAENILFNETGEGYYETVRTAEPTDKPKKMLSAAYDKRADKARKSPLFECLECGKIFIMEEEQSISCPFCNVVGWTERLDENFYDGTEENFLIMEEM